MTKIKNKYKPLLLINDQISFCKKNNLIINSYSKLELYLKNYGYYTIIKQYSFPFTKDLRYSSSTYKYNCDANWILNLFNFDRSLVPILLTNIQNLERRINNGIIYCISKKLQDLGCTNNCILNLEESFKNQLYKNYGKNGENDKFLYKIGESLLKNQNNSEEKIKYLYMDELFSVLTFGQILKYYSKLIDSLQYEIMKYVFTNNEFTNVHEFKVIMKCIKEIRNKVCHNNRVYDIKLNINRKIIRNFLRKNLDIDNSKIRLYTFVKIIDYLSPSYKNQSETIIDLFDKKVEKYIDPLPSEYKQIIYDIMVYKK